MAELKTDGNCKKLVVAGCLAERYRSEIQKEIPEIDFIFGPDELGRILEAVQLDSGVAGSRRFDRRAVYLQGSPDDSAHPDDAVVHGVLEDLRRLRSRLHVLRDSRFSGQIPQPNRSRIS